MGRWQAVTARLQLLGQPHFSDMRLPGWSFICGLVSEGCTADAMVKISFPVDATTEITAPAGKLVFAGKVK